MTEQQAVKKALSDICLKVGFTDVDQMTQRDYELVSREIETSTGILISVSTIKRLINGDFVRMPQTATLNAVSTYLGFKNWLEYKTSISHPVDGSDHHHNAGVSMKPPRAAGKSIALNWKWMALIMLGVGAVLIFTFIELSSKSSPHYNEFEFSFRKTTANSIPNTVIFDYNIDDVDADSFFIQQSWDQNRRVKVQKGNYALTDIYYEPGYHVAKLIANDSIIKTVDVSIPTDKWFLYSKKDFWSSVPDYIEDVHIVKNGHLKIDKADLEKNQIGTDEEKMFFYSFFPRMSVPWLNTITCAH